MTRKSAVARSGSMAKPSGSIPSAASLFVRPPGEPRPLVPGGAGEAEAVEHGRTELAGQAARGGQRLVDEADHGPDARLGAGGVAVAQLAADEAEVEAQHLDA